MKDDLRERIADAITFHPGNRTGSPEQRHPVSLLLADTVLKTLAPELEELQELRNARTQALAVAWSEYDETVPPRDRIMQDMRDLTAVADPEHRARRGARTSLNLDAYREQVLAEVQPELDRLSAVEAAALDHARDRTGRVMTVPVTTLARKIAEKRDALAKLDEACREVDRLRAALSDAAQRIRTYGIDHVPDSLYDVVEALANLVDPEVSDGS